MALHARLAAPAPAPRQNWPWHRAKVASIPAHLLWRGDRRMEAETYLSSGHGLRLAIQGRAAGWKPLAQFARVWQPSRLKGIQVGPEFGTPFLAATQVFDIRPVPRKWLALARTDDAQNRFVTPGTLLVTCSGAVGRATVANVTHERTLISHDLLRVVPEDAAQAGWFYAYLRSPQARAMMTGAQYGHIIKHLEVGHLNALPVPVVKEERAREFREQAAKVLDLRNRAHRLTLDAEERFARAFGSLEVKDRGEAGYRLRAKALFSGRRRLEGAYHNPATSTIRRHLAKDGRGFLKLRAAGLDVWVPGRYKRVPAEDGVAYMDSAELLEVCPDIGKRFADCDFGDSHRGRVQDGWLLVPCSGQVYGIIGSVVMAGASLHDQVVSNHVMRIAPRADAKLRNGYLLTALTPPCLAAPWSRHSPSAPACRRLIPSSSPISRSFASLPPKRVPSPIWPRSPPDCGRGPTCWSGPCPRTPAGSWNGLWPVICWILSPRCPFPLPATCPSRPPRVPWSSTPACACGAPCPSPAWPSARRARSSTFTKAGPVTRSSSRRAASARWWKRCSRRTWNLWATRMSDPARLPHRGELNVEEKEVSDYLLNLDSKDGESKARFFLAHGFTREDWPRFAEALRAHGFTRPVVEIRQTPFGQSFALECEIITPDERKPCVLSVWIIEGEDPPRLVTAYPA